ncbi:MAG: ATP-binding cassette domain-containing protein, partial [Planctomycetes bacterium]|nr:ATP-binding cassette domain-containing protein [Planctomycetota bacterium]
MAGAFARLDGIGKRYGALWALRGVSLRLEPGRIVGLVGPNGSGKTTLMKILVGLVRPMEGAGEVFGEPAGPGAWR